MSKTDGPAALRRMIEMFLSGATDLDVLEFDGEKLASDWQAERDQAAAARVEAAQHLAYYLVDAQKRTGRIQELEAQAAADRAALADVRMAHTALNTLFDDAMRERDDLRVKKDTAEAALAQARHANDTERGEWSRLYALLSGSDNGTWSAADMERAIEAALAALEQAHEALAEDREKWNFDTALYVGALLLAKVYPENVFTGASGDDGPTYVVALRDALRTYAQRDALERAKALLAEIESEARKQIANPNSNASQMVVAEAIGETCRRIANTLDNIQ